MAIPCNEAPYNDTAERAAYGQGGIRVAGSRWQHRSGTAHWPEQGAAAADSAPSRAHCLCTLSAGMMGGETQQVVIAMCARGPSEAIRLRLPSHKAGKCRVEVLDDDPCGSVFHSLHSTAQHISTPHVLLSLPAIQFCCPTDACIGSRAPAPKPCFGQLLRNARPCPTRACIVAN